MRGTIFIVRGNVPARKGLNNTFRAAYESATYAATSRSVHERRFRP